MSKTNNKRGFREAPAKKLPTLVCTGYVSKVHEGKAPDKSAGKIYTVNRVDINGYGGSRNVSVYLLSLPEWFATDLDEEGVKRPAFRPTSLEEEEGGASKLFVYRKNIRAVSDDVPSTLQGLAGTEDRFYDLCDALLDAEGIDGPESPKVISDTLTAFLTPEGEEPVEIGYVLKQKRTKTDDVDEDGKAIYILENSYEISDWWEPTEANKKKYRKSAEKSAERAAEKGEPVTFKVAFEQGTPF